MAVAKAREFGYDTLACASTGNLANAVAAAGARNGLTTYVFLPDNTEANKLALSLVYGARLVAVRGTYDELNRLCSEIADTYHWAVANVNMRPYYAEGSKTLAFETAEQLGWAAPDHVVVPVASGSLLIKTAKGFAELMKVGLLNEQPIRISGAQALGCAPVYEAYRQGWEIVRPLRHPQTVAKSLAIGNPADGAYVLQTVRETGGAIEAASEAEIIDGIKLLATTEGIFTETAGGVTVAVLKQLAQQGVIHPDERVVAYITGNGLKTLEAVESSLGQPLVVEPTLESFAQALERATAAPVPALVSAPT